MNRVRIKICGITRPEDGITAAQEGADAIGLVFYPLSKRRVTISVAKSIIGEISPFVTTVGLFVDATEEEVNSVLQDVHLDLLQFHGSETQEDCLRYNKPYIKAVKMTEDIKLIEQINIYDKSIGILLDAFVPGVAGGSGETFNWELIPDNIQKPLILAGGLNPGNIRNAIDRVKPYAVDVSSGVESEPGIKNRDKIKKFINYIRNSL
ncbi:MAG: phosphoribosylanthranilate isomerase [Gammaproteobacteria bacterium]|jgi:phosphoribosylanthranilate isomerase